MPRVFIPNPAAAAELASEALASKGVKQMTENARDAAQRVAPVDSGDYRDGLKVIDSEDGPVLVAEDWKSHWMEFGTIAMPPHAPMRRGITEAGFELRETTR